MGTREWKKRGNGRKELEKKEKWAVRVAGNVRIDIIGGKKWDGPRNGRQSMKEEEWKKRKNGR